MATIKKVWGTDTDIEGTSGAPTTLSGTTEEFSSSVDLETDGYEGTVVEIQVAWTDGATDTDVIVKVYGGTDATWTNHVADMTFRLPFPGATATEVRTYVIRDYAHFRIGVAHAQTPTTACTVYIHHQPWRWDST